MSYTHPETPERNAASPRWWTAQRTKVASLCGLIGGLGVLGVAGFMTGPTGLGTDPGISSLVYPLSHVLLAVPLLAANAWYGSKYGRNGRIVAVLLALSLVGYAGLSTVIFIVGPAMLGDLLVPIGVLSGTTFMLIRLFGSIYGGYLWWQANGQMSANRLTAGLFIILLPAIFVLGLLTQLGFPGWVLNAPFGLAFVALSYDLWTVNSDASGRRTPRSES